MAEETPKRRRKKSEPERIDLAEWGNAGALDGLLSFLNIPPHDAPVNQGPHKVLDLLEQRQSDQIITTKPGQSQSVIDTVPVIDTVSVIQMNAAASAWHPKQTTGFGNKKLYHCKQAQDGHSHTEEALYQLLWRSGKVESENTRLTIMGLGEMSKRLRLSFNNTKHACQRLIAKLALEEVAREISEQRQGKTYRIFSYKEILYRRKACGMEWVIRNKGIEFVTPELRAAHITGTVPDIDSAGRSHRKRRHRR